MIYTPGHYQADAARTINSELSDEEMVMHAALGMASEAGEIAGLHQKVYQGHAFDHGHVKKELGDLLWFVAEYCTAMGWQLQDVMQTNIEKLRARFPEGFEAERSLHRADGDI